jgi:AraC-like DNA-binding protein
MKLLFEKLTIPTDASWAMLNRRLETGIPFQWHHHPEFELTLTLNSCGQRYVGDTIEPYDDGDLVLLGPNLPHTWCSAHKIDPSEPHVALVMWFKPEWAEALLAVLTELRPVTQLLASASRGIVFSQATSQEVRPVIESMPTLDPVERLTRLMEVLAALAPAQELHYLTSSNMDQRIITAPNQERIDRIFEYIHTHYQSDISITELADLAGLSLSGFHRFFRRHTQLTVTEYVAQLRIGQACSLLISTELPVAYISDIVGYANLAHFNRQFKALKLITPREFRNSFRR